MRSILATWASCSDWPPTSTSCVWVWPPTWSPASKSTTSWASWRRWALTSPEIPLPTMAIRTLPLPTESNFPIQG